MSKLVATMIKLTQGKLGPALNHDFRKTDRHSNPDIDPQKRNQNFHFGKRHSKKEILQLIDDRKTSKRKIRSDAIVVSEWVVSSDHEFFEGMSHSQIKDFFRVSGKYFADKFGVENVAYAEVHMDETTPHMHLGIIPMTQDGRLSAKKVFDRKTLTAVQDELPAALKKAGFELERGQKGSERKKLTVPEYKQAQERIKQAEAKKQKIDLVTGLLEKEFKKHNPDPPTIEDCVEAVEKYPPKYVQEDPKPWQTLAREFPRLLRIMMWIIDRLRYIDRKEAELKREWDKQKSAGMIRTPKKRSR